MFAGINRIILVFRFYDYFTVYEDFCGYDL